MPLNEMPAAAPVYQMPAAMSPERSAATFASTMPSAAAARPVLRQGDNGTYVMQLQDGLNRLGFLSSTPDGFFGSVTAAAVRAFQTANRLNPDGIVGPQTWSALDEALASQTITGARPTLREGSTGLNVKDLQFRLITLGFYTGNADGIFGPRTAAAVREFQRAANINVDGIVGPATWNALDNALSATPTPPTEVPNITLRQGSTGPEVRLLQEKLRVLGFYSGAVDSIFGSATYNAVRNFQTAYGITSDGIVGPVTWAVLNEATSPPSSVRPVIKEGATGGDVTILQEKLKFLGFFAGSVTGSFGPETTAAVKAFQAANGLEVDGVVGARTWAVLFEETTTPTPPGEIPGGPRPTLRYGDSGPYVVDLQTELKLLMLYDGAITGQFDNATTVAVKAFQDINNLTPDGIVGRSTWNALISLYPPPVVCG